MRTRRTVLKTLAGGTVLLTAGSVGSAGGDHDSDREDESQSREDKAKLRVAHASPDAPAVDVLVDGDAVVEELAFREVTDYLEVPAGEYTVEVQTSDDGTTVFGPADVELAAEDYTAVALGEVTSDDTEFTVSVFEDTNGANIDEDEARLRAIHASPDAPSVTVTVDDGGLTLFEDVAFGESSDYAVVPADTYEVEVRPGEDCDPVFEADVTLEGGATHTAFAVGYLDTDDAPADEEFGLVPTVDATAPPRGEGGDRDR